MPVIYMDRASAESLTEKDIREIIDENLMDLKYGMLTDYYVGAAPNSFRDQERQYSTEQPSG